MIIGHQKQWNFLKKLAEAEKIPHAFLFAGQEKLGKRKLALDWISLLLKEEQVIQHPDLILIEPEKREIQISQIRNLIWKLALKPYSASFKVALIDVAHSMNQEAQTSLLKTLEEPRGNSVLILITESPNSLLSTILSRVQTLKFYPVGKEDIKDYLLKQKISAAEAEEIAEVSLGRPGVAVDFVSDLNKLEERNQKIRELEKISKADLAIRFQYAKDLAENQGELKEVLDVWLKYFRNILLSKINGSKDYGQYSLVKLRNILKLIQSTNFLLSSTNVNSKLALEILMLEI